VLVGSWKPTREEDSKPIEILDDVLVWLSTSLSSALISGRCHREMKAATFIQLCDRHCGLAWKTKSPWRHITSPLPASR
jgi:hypothetical protein